MRFRLENFDIKELLMEKSQQSSLLYFLGPRFFTVNQTIIVQKSDLKLFKILMVLSQVVDQMLCLVQIYTEILILIVSHHW